MSNGSKYQLDLLEELREIFELKDVHKKLLENNLSHEKTIIQLEKTIESFKLELESLKNLQNPTESVIPIDKTTLHLGFLFSSPLILVSNDGTACPLDSLECEKEYDKIISYMKATDKKIKCHKFVATLENLALCLNENPLVIHFTGHGIVEKNSNGTASYSLLFEDNEGTAFGVDKNNISQILKGYKKPPELAFISACHSEHVGKIFLEAGISHVICVKLLSTIIDEVAIKFAETFYKLLFSGSEYTVCMAFEKSMEIVKSCFSANPNLAMEVKKIKLLTQKCGITGVHECTKFPKFEKGVPMTFLETLKKPEFDNLPHINNIIGRNKDLYKLLHELINSRFITVTGFPGIGKSSLAINLGKYLSNRNYFPNGVIYISLKEFTNIETLISYLLRFALESENEILPKSENPKTFMLKLLKKKHFLLILDNAEELIIKSDLLSKIITELLSEIPKIYIILTSRCSISSVNGVLNFPEKIYNLRSLDAQSSVMLLETFSPRELKFDEIIELLNPQNKLQITFENFQEVFSSHELIKMMSGHPHIIALVSSLLKTRNLAKIYQTLSENWDKESKIMNPLAKALNFSMQFLTNKNPKTVTFMKFMSLFQTSIPENNIEQIWGADSIEHLDNLLEISLIEQTESEEIKGIRKFFLLSFMLDYAHSYIKNDISSLFNKSSNYFAELLEKLISQYIRSANQKILTIPIDLDQAILGLISRFDKTNGTTLFDQKSIDLGEKIGEKIEEKPFVKMISKINFPSRDAISSLTKKVAAQVRRKNIKEKIIPVIPQEKTVTKTLAKFTKISEPIEENKGDIGKMSSFGKLLVNYMTALILAKRFSEAIIIAEEKLLRIKENRLTFANMLKLKGCAVCENENPTKLEKAKNFYIEAQKIYKELGSINGSASCNIGLAEISLIEVFLYENFKKIV